MIPVNEPLFISDEKKYLEKCIDEGWVSSDGSFVKEFEEGFSKYVGRKYGVAVSSGTAALEVAVGALGIKEGDEVIMPSFTIISCVLAVVNYGAVPVFIDSDPETFTIDVTKIEERITEKTKAIMAVHIYGHPCDMDPILEIAKKHNLLVIEDAAEAHGAEYLPDGRQGKGNPPSLEAMARQRKCGSFGDISIFSFYANKIITTGEGGMVLTDNEEYAERARSLRNLAFGKGEKRYHHEELARNYRMTNLQAALGVAQLNNIDKLVNIKINNAKKYTELLKDVKGLTLPIEKEWAKNVYWMYGVVLDPPSHEASARQGESLGMTAEDFAKKLLEAGVQTRQFFYPMHLQPVFEKYNKGNFPVSEKLARYGLYLPSGMALKESQIKEVVEAIKKILH